LATGLQIGQTTSNKRIAHIDWRPVRSMACLTLFWSEELAQLRANSSFAGNLSPF
jgi:hypothetical protein